MAALQWPRWLYSAALYALAPLIGWRIWREQVPAYSRLQRLGYRVGELPPAPRIWLHCASVGEVRAARPLIDGLLARYPEHALLLTTMTATGAEQAQALVAEYAGQRALAHRFLPLDFPSATRRFVSRVNPVLAIMFETELWPNVLHACRVHGVPVAVVNGRLSARAFKRYVRLRPLMAGALANVAWLAAKSPADAERFAALGAAPERLASVGSLKFETMPDGEAVVEGERLLTAWGNRPVWVAGSTRDGEEPALLAAHRLLLERFPDALLVLAPRHPQRFADVARLCRAEGFQSSRRSQAEPVTSATQVYLGDTLGELATLYAAGHIAFVGGSLVPLGGHNVLEPAALGRPVITGPSLDNFTDVAEPLLAAQALQTVETPQALADAVAAALKQPDQAHRRGQAGQAAVLAQRGALARTLDGLSRWLG